MKKFLAVLLTLCTAMTLLTGCGGPKMKADESVKAIYDLYITGKTDGAKKLGLSDSDIKEVIDTYDTALKDTIKSNLAPLGVEVTDEQLTGICDARKVALSKMTADCEIVSSDKKTASIKLSTTYFDETALDETAVNAALEAASTSEITDETEMMKFVLDAYIENIISAYGTVTPSTDKKEITVSCSIQDNTWLPDDMTGFGGDLGLAVSGQ